MDLTVSYSTIGQNISDATVSSSDLPGEIDTLPPQQREAGPDCVLSPHQELQQSGVTTPGEGGTTGVGSQEEMGIPNTWSEDEPFATAAHCVLDYWNLPDPPPGFDQMPDLDSQPSTAHYSSPVHNTLFTSDAENILTENDAQDAKGVGVLRGVCGLRNLGNTCFMNAGIQCLLNNPSCVRFFVETFETDETTKDTMASKFADLITKVWSGLYSSVQPVEFKEVLAKHHPQFRDYRQHDCQEFLALLLDTLHEQLNTGCNKSCDDSSIVNSVTSGDDKTVEVDFEETPPSLTTTVDDDLEDEEKLSTDEKKELPQMDVTDHEEARDSTTPVLRAPQQVLSDNSSHSASPHSTDSFSSWDMNVFRLYPVPEDVKPFKDPQRTQCAKELEIYEPPNNIDDQKNLVSTEDLQRKQRSRTCSVENIVRKPEKNEIAHKLNIIRKLPTIEDFVKETKTLNTNVLISDEPNNQLKFDSEKFPKSEPTRPQETLDNLSELMALGPIKNYPLKRVKDTNLLQENVSAMTNVQQAVVAKRMKIDEKSSPQDLMETESGAPDDSEMSSSSDQQDTTVPEELDADNEWEKYQAKNQSVVVDTFQGQFKSTVVCAECCHVSVTYEPFMYLPVPLPHALEKQVVVTYVPFGGKQPHRHLVTLHKNDKVQRLKELLLGALGTSEAAPQDVILAEVFGSHISKILDDSAQVRYLNILDRDLYAFEMSPIQLKEAETPPGGSLLNLQQATAAAGISANTAYVSGLFGTEQTSTGHFENNHVSSSGDGSVPRAQPSSAAASSAASCASTIAIPLPAPPGMMPPEAPSTTTPTVSGWPGSGDIATDNSVTSTTMDYGPSTSSAEATPVPLVSTCHNNPMVEDSNVTMCSSSSSVPLDPWQRKPVCAGWQTCVICLEEMPRSNLRVHRSCQCLLCFGCVEMSCKHFGSNAFVCPVCGLNVRQEEFLPITVIEEYKTNIRNLPLPVVFRLSVKGGVGAAEESHRLVGHPALLQVPDALPASSLYEWVDKCVPFPAPFSLCFVDGQGLNCSRCMYSQRCRGCEVAREGDVSLLPSDSLAVCFEEELLTDHLSAPPLEHKSMRLRRNQQALSLYDCLQAFSESETLDEQNPWYCPVCQRHQQASKSLSIWRCPDTLMVYLKRFMFHEYSSTKVDDRVQFPLEGLDLSPYVSGPTSPENVLYDLQACVCHFGGVSSGHYTAYSKHATSGEWYNFNDEATRKQKPQDEDHSQAYILFYQRPGMDLAPSFAKNPSVLFEKPNISPDEGSCSSEPRLKPDTLNSILKQLEDDSCAGEEVDITSTDPVQK